MDTNFLPPIRTDADIRVLTLAPNQNNSSGHSDVIACEFENISIGGSVLYTAVSYVWGDDSCLRSIAINGVVVQVRNNLWQFLHQMRQDSHTGYLWIDALCIDQKNLEERSSQVAIMGKIYSGAANVFVWLGAATEASEEERLLGTVSLCFLEPNGVLAVKRNRRIHQHSKNLLARLSKHVYWTRVWVTQEFILA
ncbi:heterokaryon incompatibility protein-domain-containing protein, partial [Boeremia exigua]|uniref:heterokaryon incompatibility protein-domain-containing protein n=1 Tax=Boeremia exigua TaxID=749465 RepID=UPI001E8D44DE